MGNGRGVINVKEIRVGNYVDLFGTIATIQRTDFLGKGVAIKSGKSILLNKEWLLKLGFLFKEPKLGTAGVYTNGIVNVHLSNNGNVYTTKGQIIPYVHLFQNWYYFQNLKLQELKITKNEN